MKVETVAMPYMIGCGIGGGQWEVVYQIIKDVFDEANENVILYKILKNKEKAVTW